MNFYCIIIFSNRKKRMECKFFNGKVQKYNKLNHSIKVKDILNSMKRGVKAKFYFVQYILPINETVSIPVVFCWNLGGNKIKIIGEWDGWRRKISLIYSNNEFTTIIPLYPKKFEYRFIIDGQLKCAMNHKSKKTSSGNVTNIANLQKFRKKTEYLDSFCNKKKISVLNGFHNYHTGTESYKNDLPVTPPCLIGLLETDFMRKVGIYCASSSDSPIYNYVLLNHLFFFIQKNILELKQNVLFLRTRIEDQKMVSLLFLSPCEVYLFRKKHPLKKKCFIFDFC